MSVRAALCCEDQQVLIQGHAAALVPFPPTAPCEDYAAKSFARCSPLRQLPGLSVLAHVSGAVVVCPSLAVGSAVMTVLVHLTHSQMQALSTVQHQIMFSSQRPRPCRSTRPLSQSLPTSTTLKGRQQRMLAKLVAWTCCGSSTSPQLRLWPMALRRRAMRPSWCLTWVVAPLMCPCWRWVVMQSSQSAAACLMTRASVK